MTSPRPTSCRSGSDYCGSATSPLRNGRPGKMGDVVHPNVLFKKHGDSTWNLYRLFSEILLKESGDSRSFTGKWKVFIIKNGEFPAENKGIYCMVGGFKVREESLWYPFFLKVTCTPMPPIHIFLRTNTDFIHRWQIHLFYTFNYRWVSDRWHSKIINRVGKDLFFGGEMFDL